MVAIAKLVWKMQKKVWYCEKWVGCHASFPPRQSVNSYIYCSFNHAGVIDGATLQSNYEIAQAIASEPIYDTIIYDTIDEEGQENIEMSPLNTATVSTIWNVKGLSDLKM